MTPEGNPVRGRRVRAPKDATMRYLLGELPEAQADALEREYFASDELFERLGAAETDLLDEYVRGELTGPERDAFEQRLNASASLRSRLESATGIAAGLDGIERGRRRSLPRWVLPLAAAAAVLL